MRPDLRAIVHAHPPTLVAFSLARKLPNTHLIPTASEVCGEVTMAKYDVPGSEQLGRNIAEEFAKGYNSVLLENHGVVCGGKNLFGAFMSFETLDTCGRLEIDAAKLGKPRLLTDEEIEIDASIGSPRLDEFIPNSAVLRGARRPPRPVHDHPSRLRPEAVHLHPGHLLHAPVRRLVPDYPLQSGPQISGAGGHRAHQGRHVRGGQERPAAPRCLHRGGLPPPIRTSTPSSVAHPPAIMAFAVHRRGRLTRHHPGELHQRCATSSALPYASCRTDVAGHRRGVRPAKLPRGRSWTTSASIVTGASLLNAFDRLEVLEYSAKAYIDTCNIGDIINISDKEVDVIEEAFNLKNP